MSIVFLLSVILKGLGAVLEVLLQVMITRMLGLAGYGTYSTWVSAADLVYWVLFSGITKCNTFYLSNKGTELRRFKAKYYSCYVLPVLTTLVLVLALEKGRGGYTVIALITGMELLVMDHSSTMMAQGQPGCALFGEYVLGRLFLVLGTLVLYKTERLSLGTLLALYVIQYAGILVFFLIKRDREPRRDISKELSLRKWGSYQRADLIQALISQMPILLQYFFTGAFEAGIVSVVLMVKKLVNFISGPTAKVFLPEFSRMYHAGDKAGIKQCYASIMRIQMLFAGSMAVVLVGYPQVLLSILAEELLPYTKQFVGCALVFILIATLGPCSGVLQMTGNEKKDNLYREAALGVMLVLLFVMRGSRLVMLYALCVQALLEGLVKYWYVCRWMQGSAVKLKTYCIWWSVPAAVIAGGCLLHLQHSALAMLLAAGLIDIVDTLGGVDVYSELAFQTGKESGCIVDVQEGWNHLNGEQALAFSRERHALADGDNQRGKNQQAVLTAMLRKCLSPTMLLKAGTIMNQVSSEVETNLSQAQINSLIKYQLNKNATWTIQSVAATGTNDKGYCYSSGDKLLFIMDPDEDVVQKIIDLANVVEEGGTLEDGESLN